MAKHYDAPPELRQLEKMITDFAYWSGNSVSQVFNDTLRFIIHGFSPGAPPLEHWNYKRVDGFKFFEIYAEWVKVTSRQIDINGWYDAWGELYMSVVISHSTQQGGGVFFTPPHVCDLMTMFVHNGKDKFGLISDPACGSGRTLLSFNAQNPGNYLCAEDINYTCCLMSVCNFLVHGCLAEVVWHDSLMPETYQKGWAVNYELWDKGLPTIKEIPKEESYLWRSWQEKKK